jgi:hypothetical protein
MADPPQNIREYVASISPPWLSKANAFGVRFMQGMIGLVADLFLEASHQALKAPWIKQSTSPDDALPSIGNNFNIEQVPGETNAEFRDRLTVNPGAWELWQEAATRLFAENALAPFGVPAGSITLVSRSAWDPDDVPENWSRWWLILQPPLPWDEAEWGDRRWGAPETWGTDATITEIAGIIKLLCKWKSAHEVGVEIILLYDDGELWGLGDWGAPEIWTANDVVRWPLTRFWGSRWKSRSWGDKETYRPQFDGVWGSKIVI